MKVKIVEAGYQGYTGFLGSFEFEDAVSVCDLAPRDINRLSVNISIVNAEDNSAIGTLSDFEENLRASFPIETPESSGVKFASVGDVIETDDASPVPDTVTASEIVEPTKYTRVNLEALADKEGIAGLRTIADTFGVKGTSITGLIEQIINAQALVV